MIFHRRYVAYYSRVQVISIAITQLNDMPDTSYLKIPQLILMARA